MFFTFSNIGVCGQFPPFTRPLLTPNHVVVTGFNNVSFDCRVHVVDDICFSNGEFQWVFFNKLFYKPLFSGEKYEIQERKPGRRRMHSKITIFNIDYLDEGAYRCRYSCTDRYALLSTFSRMKVLSGMNNCVIISSAFSKGEIFRYKEEGGKKINAEKM